MISKLVVLLVLVAVIPAIKGFPSYHEEEEEPPRKYYINHEKEDDHWNKEDDDHWKKEDDDHWKKEDDDDFFKKKWRHKEYDEKPKWSSHGWKAMPRPHYPYKRYEYESLKPKLPIYLDNIGHYKKERKEKKEPKEDMKKEILEDVDKYIPKVYID